MRFGAVAGSAAHCVSLARSQDALFINQGARGILTMHYSSRFSGARVRVESEVQGGQIHHRALPHDQGKRLGLSQRPKTEQHPLTDDLL